MTQWQRFGDGTWVNVDHVEVLQVEEPEPDESGWQLTAIFASGRTHPLGRHDDRGLLIDCTDAFLGGEVGSHLRALADTSDETPTSTVARGPEPVTASRRRWLFWRPAGVSASSTPDAHPDVLHPQPTG